MGGLNRCLWGLLVLLVGAAAWEAHGLWQAALYNRLLVEPARIEADDDAPPEQVFAKATALAASDRREAQRLYGGLLDRGDARFREKLRYNLGTLYLEEAAELWNARGVLEYIRVNTLVAAAKEHLREALRLNPGNWDARYNLEYAFRITPPPKEKPKSDFRGAKSSVFATLPTLPGGGP